jgi:DNA-binding GntR family transcriptional regulator
MSELDEAPRYKTATEHAFTMLKQWINDGVLAPGSTIDQVQLSQTLGMSRVPVRLALERLASEGLVALAPHRSAVVMPISLQEMRDLYAVRHHLEGLATELAARWRSDEDLVELEHILEMTERQVAAGDLEGFLTSNRAFHMRVYTAAHNAVLLRVIESLWDLSERYRRAYLRLPARARESTDEHRQIYELLSARNIREARAFMQEHNDKTMRVLVEWFDRSRHEA